MQLQKLAHLAGAAADGPGALAGIPDRHVPAVPHIIIRPGPLTAVQQHVVRCLHCSIGLETHCGGANGQKSLRNVRRA